VKRALDAAPDKLTDLADQTKFPHTRTLYIETMHELHYNRKAVLSMFEETFSNGFNQLLGIDPESKKSSAKSVDTSHIFKASDLEERLALETMNSKAKTRGELSLHSVVRSLNGLLGDDWVQNHTNPIDPEFIITSWLSAIHVMQLQPKGNLAMYALLDTKVLHHLPAIYEKVNSFLAKLTKESEGMIKQSRSDMGETTDYEQDFGDIDNVDEMPDYSSFSSYESREVDSQVDTVAPLLSTTETSVHLQDELHTDALITLLDKLQRDRDLDDGNFYDSSYLMDFRDLLKSFKAIPEGVITPGTVGQINDDVIDMTALMFSFIMEDIHLPDDIRYHISRLQIPYLKLALQDKSFFINKDHAARKLLNDLSQAINRWDPTHKGGLDLLLTETMSVIDRIIEEYHTDPRIFALIGEEFNQFLSGDEHVDKEMLSRQKDTAPKIDKADNARLFVEATLDEICQDKRIPPVVNQILDDFWSKVLFLEYLKGGQDSQSYKEFVETAEMLVDSVQAKDSGSKRKEMAKQLPVIIKRLKTGFETISIASYDSIDIFRELQECHLLVLKERPETEIDEDFEVTEEEYEEFKQDENVIKDWNRGELENALLEENIERSMGYSESDEHAFDGNKNIITAKKDVVGDASVIKAAREREIIDSELKEARDAYELALKEHQQKKVEEGGIDDSGDENSEDVDDFMVQFFQDPKFIENQYNNVRDLSSDNDSSIDAEPEGQDAEDEVFQALGDDETEDFVEEISITSMPEDPLAEGLSSADGEQSDSLSNDELNSRAHGALNEEFGLLGDDKVAELVERLKVGLWVDLHQADGNLIRAKIMAIVPSVGKYIFGDRSGKKLTDFNRQSLAEALRNGVIRVNEDDNVFDKTLESVISNLRVMKKAEDD